MIHHNQKAGYYHLGSASFTTIKPDSTTVCNHALPHFHHYFMNKHLYWQGSTDRFGRYTCMVKLSRNKYFSLANN